MKALIRDWRQCEHEKLMAATTVRKPIVAAPLSTASQALGAWPKRNTATLNPHAMPFVPAAERGTSGGAAPRAHPGWHTLATGRGCV